MPELPEVETTRRGIEPHILNQQVETVVVRQPRLRWPIPTDLAAKLEGLIIRSVQRRAKYLLLNAHDAGNQQPEGTLILHLGMSGSLRVLPNTTPPEKHDHLDIRFRNGKTLRLTDPRRFGAALWTEGKPGDHPLIAKLGPEPLLDDFDADTLINAAKGRKIAVKSFIMDGNLVVGVGNIYASESLFRAGIHPTRPAGRVSAKRYRLLATAIKEVLAEAIEQGGTTLRDFTQSDGKPGYFRIKLAVYDRAGEPCRQCGEAIRQKVIGQRSSFYCPRCQS